MATERLSVVITERGSRTVQRNIRNVGQSADRAAIHTNRLRSALTGLAGTFGLFALGRLVDQYTNLQNRLRFVTKDTAQLNAVTKQLFEISNSTRSSFEASATIYSRVALAVKEMGVSAQETLNFTKSLNQAVLLSGASGQEATNAMIQLSQGLASGTLRGDELRSVLEQLPVVADVIAKQLGVTRGELRKMGFEGKITTEIILAAFKTAAGGLNEAFANSVPTMSQAFAVLKNSITEVVGELDKQFKVSENVAKAMLFLSQNMETVVRVVALFALTVGTALLPGLATIIARFTPLDELIRKPFALGIVSLVAFIGYLAIFGDKMQIASDSATTVRDVFVTVWKDIQTGLQQLYQFFQPVFVAIAELANKAFGTMDLSFKNVVLRMARILQALVNAFVSAYRTILETWQYLPRALFELVYSGLKRALEAVWEFVSRAASALKNFIVAAVTLDFSEIIGGKLDPWVESASGHIADTFREKYLAAQYGNTGIIDYFNGVFTRADDEAKKRIEELKKTQEELKRGNASLTEVNPKTATLGDDKDKKRGRKTFADYLAELERERELGLATGQAYQVLNTQIEIANKLRRDLTETEKGLVEQQVLENENLKLKRTLLEEIKGPGEEYNLSIQALNELYSQGAITLEEYNSKFYQLRENFLNGLPEATTFADGFTQQIQKMQQATSNGFASMGTEVAQIFGPGGTLVNGIGDAIAQSIVFGKSFKEQIRGVAQSILSQLIGSLVKMGLNMILNATLGQGLMATSVATSAAAAGATAAAWAPAAGMASLATGGANAAGASTGITTILSLVTGLAGSLFSGKGFEKGGYTGPVGVKQIAGVVHGQEFVINAAATKRHRGMLEAINAGREPGAMMQQAPSAPVNVSITNEIPDAAFEVRPLGEKDVEIIAKRIVQRDAADVISSDLRNPNSRTSKSLGANTTASRRR